MTYSCREVRSGELSQVDRTKGRKIPGWAEGRQPALLLPAKRESVSGLTVAKRGAGQRFLLPLFQVARAPSDARAGNAESTLYPHWRHVDLNIGITLERFGKPQGSPGLSFGAWFFLGSFSCQRKKSCSNSLLHKEGNIAQRTWDPFFCTFNVFWLIPCTVP